MGRKLKTESKLIGESDAIKKNRKDIDYVAKSNKTILIQGPTGTGKDLIAREIHQKSERNDKPLEILDCGTLSTNLFESELFGHVKGAFTGADRTKRGFAELANGGTIFLDEIGNLHADNQRKLLRFLQDGTFRTVGGDTEKKANVRIIAATNKDLQLEIREGRFADDFYQRLCQFIIRTEPLAGRHEDIILLAHHFIKSKKVKPDPKSMFLLYAYDFSDGNVRALERLIGNADNYNSVREEMLRTWSQKNGVPTALTLPLPDPHLATRLTSDALKKLQQADSNLHVYDAVVDIEKYAIDYERTVRAYEIAILKSKTKLSDDIISAHLHISRQFLTPKGFKQHFGLDLDALMQSEKFSYIPDFLRYWIKSKTPLPI